MPGCTRYFRPDRPVNPPGMGVVGDILMIAGDKVLTIGEDVVVVATDAVMRTEVMARSKTRWPPEPGLTLRCHAARNRG